MTNEKREEKTIPWLPDEVYRSLTPSEELAFRVIQLKAALSGAKPPEWVTKGRKGPR